MLSLQSRLGDYQVIYPGRIDKEKKEICQNFLWSLAELPQKTLQYG